MRLPLHTIFDDFLNPVDTRRNIMIDTRSTGLVTSAPRHHTVQHPLASDRVAMHQWSATVTVTRVRAGGVCAHEQGTDRFGQVTSVNFKHKSAQKPAKY
jgi:hypothetical protein